MRKRESAVSGPFMTGIRAALPGAQVLKHADRSFIGMGDCSVTWNQTISWLEFKCWIPGVRWDGHDIPVQKIAMESKAQLEFMQKMSAHAHLSAYICWAWKSRRIALWVLDPIDLVPKIDYYKTTPEVIEVVRRMLMGLKTQRIVEALRTEIIDV
jgi:hypothetical protein